VGVHRVHVVVDQLDLLPSLNVVPAILPEAPGLSPGVAALALGPGGVGQVAGRLGYARFAATTTPTSRLVIVGMATATTPVALAIAPPKTPSSRRPP
jgi:hypothetical protein